MKINYFMSKNLLKIFILFFCLSFADESLSYNYNNSITINNNPDSIYKKGDDLYNKGKYKQSLNYFKKVLLEYKNRNEIKKTAMTYSRIGNIYESIGEFKKAYNNYKKCLSYYQDANDEKGIAHAYNNIGNIYMNRGDYHEAINFYRKSLNIRKNLNLKYEIPLTLNNIGNVYFQWEKYQKALEYYLEAYNTIKLLDDNSELPVYLNNIANSYLLLKQYDSALVYFNKCMNVSKKMENNYYIAITYVNLGVLYKEKSNYDKSLNYYKKAFNLANKVGMKTEKAIILQNIGELYIITGEYNKSIDYLNKALNISKKQNTNRIICDIYRLLSKSYTKKGNYKKGLKYFKEYTSLKDSLFNEKSSRQLSELETKYKTEKKEKEIQIKKVKIANQQKVLKIQRYIFISSIVLLIFILYFLYKYMKNKTQRKVAILEKELNEQMQMALSSQMNPHFISNALNSIQRFFLDNNEEIANNYLADFSSLIRSILENSRESKISLKKEIDCIQFYLSLESMRLDNKFDYHIEIHENVDIFKTCIPSLIIQPYIENAIWYGIAPLDTKGDVYINIKQDNDFLECIIEDNGIGINKSKELVKRKKHKSLGMKINKRRLELLNKTGKKKMNVQIFDINELEEHSQGTRVILNIPV